MNNLPMAAGWALSVLLLEVLTYSTLLSNDILSRTFQIVFFGPLLGAGTLLRHMRDSWDLPIPSTQFGGFPGWLDGLLFLMNWLVYALLGVFLLKTMNRQTKLRD